MYTYMYTWQLIKVKIIFIILLLLLLIINMKLLLSLLLFICLAWLSSDDDSWALKMITAQVVETSVTNNSLSRDYPLLDDHVKQITDTPGFKPFTILLLLYDIIER